jgi:arylsulfatase A-like enzyme
MDGLKELGIEQNTLVIFLTDNGALPTFDGARNTGLRGSKMSLYEGGIRLPFIARWPGKIPAGHVDDETVLSGLDMFPTLAAIAGADLPKRVTFDGQDMSAALRGTPQPRKAPLFWEYGRNNEFFSYPKPPGARSPNVATRDGKWKLLVNADGSGAELYDVLADPNERYNVADKETAVAERLKGQTLGWRRALPPAPKRPE